MDCLLTVFNSVWLKNTLLINYNIVTLCHGPIGGQVQEGEGDGAGATEEDGAASLAPEEQLE